MNGRESATATGIRTSPGIKDIVRPKSGDAVIGAVQQFILSMPKSPKVTQAALKGSIFVEEVRKLQREGVI